MLRLELPRDVIELDRLGVERRVDILGVLLRVDILDVLDRLGVLTVRLDMVELLVLEVRDRELELAALRLLLLLLLELLLFLELLPARTGSAKKTAKQKTERIRSDGERRTNERAPPVFCLLLSVF